MFKYFLRFFFFELFIQLSFSFSIILLEYRGNLLLNESFPFIINDLELLKKFTPGFLYIFEGGDFIKYVLFTILILLISFSLVSSSNISLKLSLLLIDNSSSKLILFILLFSFIFSVSKFLSSLFKSNSLTPFFLCLQSGDNNLFSRACLPFFIWHNKGFLL